MGTRRQFSREFKLEAVRLVKDRGVSVTQAVRHGSGNAPDVLPDIFRPFVQGPRRSAEGGLGLALAHGMVQLHGGSIAAESLGEGQGAIFTVMLPAAAHTAAR